MIIQDKNKIVKIVKIISILIIFGSFIFFFPQVRNLIVDIAERILGRKLDRNFWMGELLKYSLYMLGLGFSLLFLSIIKKLLSIIKTIIKKAQDFLEKRRSTIEIFLVVISVIVIIISIIVRIVMYARVRSLWLDEALLAQSFVAKNWLDLLTPPLMNNQSAPVLYVIFVKAICAILGYTEFSLRFFSLLAFLGLLVCLTMFLRNVFKLSNLKTAVIVVIASLLPGYIWYSNELKPYMSDAFFIILTILLYFYYNNGKIKLPLLSVLYIIILGFSSPAIFFIGGIFIYEFITAVINKDKKVIWKIIISGAAILVIFCIYYYWWMLPVTDNMMSYWGRIHTDFYRIRQIFNPGVGYSDSSFIWYFVPFSILGIFSLAKNKNKIACSTAISVLLLIIASCIGYWPPTGRLWLFLPAVILVFIPSGIDIIKKKLKAGILFNTIEFSVFSIIIIFMLVNCLKYTGDKMYNPTQEINPLIDYVQKNIKDDEKLYVYPSARYAFEYKNGYGNYKIGNVNNDNIIFGINRNEWNENNIGNELQSILDNEKTYLIFQHYWVGIDKGLDELRNYGTLTEILNYYNTPLYYFENKVKNGVYSD